MASKKYKGKLCVYCAARLSEGRDHVFAREFFMPGAKYQPIIVPACSRCNNEKSELEHYLTAVLPFGGQHADASAHLGDIVPGRLQHNAKLHRVLAEGRRTVWVKDADLYVPTMSLPIDFHTVELLFQFIVRGLAWHHWKVMLTEDDFIITLALSKDGERVFEQKFFRVNVSSRVLNDLANGTFTYEGVQGVDNPCITAWRMRVYGGIAFGGDPAAPNQVSSIVGAFSGPRRAFRYAELRTRFAPGI